MTAVPGERVVIVTQDDRAGSRLSALLTSAGVRVRVVPVIRSEAVADLRLIDEALSRLSEFDWVAFTSARAADIVCARPAWRMFDWREAPRPRVAVVGPVTREAVERSGCRVALCPGDAGADALAAALVEAGGGDLTATAVLWPRSAIARPELRDTLLAAHARVVDPIAYTTTPVVPADLGEAVEAIQAGRVHAVTFLSPSAAESFAAAVGTAAFPALVGRTAVASVGPTTTAALVRLGAPPTVEAEDRTSGGLAAVLLSWFDSNKGDLP
jgi:uroporphyrinogen-III synthase